MTKRLLRERIYSGTDNFNPQFYHIYKEELMLILLKLLNKTETAKTLIDSFCRITVSLITKPDKEPTKK